MKVNLLIIASLFLLLSVAADSESEGGGRSIEWQILTKQNFSSQIHLHPHLLLMVTVPWSGESRFLMKELTRAVAYKQEKLGSLKLMLMYRSNERMLADAIDAREGITFLYYHHSVSYKYQGRLCAQNILSSINSVVSLLPDELPLRPLNTPEDLKSFLASTDNAIILLEFCGWTPKLLAKGKNNGTEKAFGVQGGLFGKDSNGETSRTLSRGKKDQKGMNNEKMSCGVENGFRGIPGLEEFSSLNDSAAFPGTESRSPGVGSSCTFEEFQQFDSFFPKFISVAREFFLPPERQQFGLVSKRSLLSSLGVEDSGSWLAVRYFAGCPGCLKIFREGDDLKSLLQMHNSLVTELEDDGHDVVPVLSANKPSILLFVDRSSDSSATREKSKVALDAFRELALNYQTSHHMDGQNNDKPVKSSVQSFQAFKSTSEHHRLEISPTSQKIEVKDKMSIMIINEGKHVSLDNVASDLHGTSLHEILAYFLQHKKEAKLSSLAKESGFQLLSDDFDVKIEDTLPSQTEVQSNQVSPELPMEGLVRSSNNLNKDQPYIASISALEKEEISRPTDVEPSSQHSEEKPIDVGTSKKLISVEPDKILANHELAIDEDVKVEENSFSQIAKLGEQQLHFQGFKGSFIFSDGGYRLLRALTAGLMIPSLVIIDPISEKHYVFPEDADFSYSSLADFLDGFLNGSLIPYQRSESVLASPREATRPPFVNLDFHEVDSIPRVTALKFSDLVLGFNQSSTQNTGHAWTKDVLVLFSNSWCGFCQRMELVVREVYRALKGYTNMLKSEVRNVESVFSSDNLKDVMSKLPVIYLMDCTLNECSSILKSMGQREVYPALLLFPAERKNALSYEGNMAVFDVIKFLAVHGHNSHLIGEKGILWTEVEKGGRNQNLFNDASLTAIHEEPPVAKEKYHEVLLKNRRPKRPIKYTRIRPHASEDLHETAPRVVVGSILVATEKLLSVHPFDKSTILIVKADHNSGFQGLIVNKRINWNSLQELADGLEMLKEAPLSFGGPLIQRGRPLVALARRIVSDQYPEVLPGVYFLNQSATINEMEGLKVGNVSVSNYWFFLGYSRWDWEQLFDEIAEGDWNITDGKMGQLDWP